MSFLSDLKEERRQRRYIRKMHRRGYYSNFGEEKLTLEYLASLALPEKQKFAVDIAAADGIGGSNSYGLFLNGYRGLAVEANTNLFAFMSKLYRSLPDVSLMRLFVTPENVLQVLAAADTPKEFGFLSLDIDGYDHFVLSELLSVYAPVLICAEFNEKLPPPLKFTIKYDPKFSCNLTHCYGQSISKLYEITERFEYDLIGAEYNNAFLISRRYNKWPALSAAEAYKAGYLDKADRLDKLSANIEFEPAQQMSPVDAIAFFQAKFVTHAGKYVLEL